MIINLPIERVSRVTNTSNSFTHKMAAKISWHRYRTKLRHCHPMYACVQSSLGTNRPSFAAANQVVTLTRVQGCSGKC